MLLFAPALADELVYQRTWRVDDAGATDERLVGSPTVRLASGREWTPTTTSLIDPDGRAYGVDWQVGQDIEGGATSIAMQVWRFDGSTSALESEVPFENGDIDLLDSGVRGPAPVIHEAELSLGEGVEAWIEAGDDADTRALFLKVRDEEEFGPPPILEGLLDTDPVAYLDRLEERTLYVLDYASEFEASVVDLAADLNTIGVTVTAIQWTSWTIEITATPAHVRQLASDPRLVRIGLLGEARSDSNDGAETRASTQTQQFLDAGYTGEAPSANSVQDDMYVVVADTCIDEDHPAWNDEGPFYNSRLGAVWRWDGGFRPLYTYEDSAEGDCHGMGVSSILLANLLDGQDLANRATPGEQAQSSGVAVDATFAFIEIQPFEGESPTFSSIGAKVIALSPDVFNMSFSTGAGCDVDSPDNDVIDSMYASNIFVAKSASNDGHLTCTTNAPATASGAFTVGALTTSGVADLNSGWLDDLSSAGDDVHGRAIVDLVAPGRETSATAKWNDTYRMTGEFAQTSAATPTVAGAATILKDFLSSLLGAAWTNDVGNLHATMLLMGDGTRLSSTSLFNPLRSAPGPVAIHGDALDPAWGAGRMRMRLFTDAGMDGPWRARWCIRTVSSGGAVAPCLANPDSTGVNQALSADVERLRATAFWHEPNLGSLEDPANIAFAAFANGAFKYQTSGTAPGSKRLREDSAGGATWDVRLVPWCVPPPGALFDSAHPYANCGVSGATRKVHIAMYWEDMDRDDGGFPPASIQ